MDVNRTTLQSLYVGFSNAFQNGFAGAASDHGRITTMINSTTAEEEYGWLTQFPNVREWLGDRVINAVVKDGYRVKNKSFELTVGVQREHIEDDNLGIYAPMFSELGRSVAAFPDQLVFGLLKGGFATKCYDGQYFFDTDHPVLDENGTTVSVANTDGGSGAPWFLMDVSRTLKPLIYQSRKPFNRLIRKDRDEDDNVFLRSQYLYGTDGRCNAGFGFWQMAWGSKQTLNAANYAIARAALMNMKGDHGRPLGLRPGLLVVPPSLESAARKILNSEYAAGGETNEWKGTAELMVTPWLA